MSDNRRGVKIYKSSHVRVLLNRVVNEMLDNDTDLATKRTRVVVTVRVILYLKFWNKGN
ncbi:hypothetical protein [Salipaludibacillus neizhouensis]|uniref:hypothetical protein n=1 Tax=Salipaludibacillus neizhouensis TaxID=885475 RepID=UPI0016038C5C|nr:hypothetical protein [Salipaludibacillus neizhouensis]